MLLQEIWKSDTVFPRTFNGIVVNWLHKQIPISSNWFGSIWTKLSISLHAAVPSHFIFHTSLSYFLPDTGNGSEFKSVSEKGKKPKTSPFVHFGLESEQKYSVAGECGIAVNHVLDFSWSLMSKNEIMDNERIPGCWMLGQNKQSISAPRS